MKRSQPRLESEALLLLKQALAPNAEVREARNSSEAEAVVKLRGGMTLSLKLVPWAEDARRRSRVHNTVWIVPRATRVVRDRLRDAQESYIDLHGAVFLSFPNLLVDRERLQPSATTTGVSRSFDPFTDRSTLVLRTLLEWKDEGRKTWGVRELADVAGVGPATVTRVVRELKRYQVVDFRRIGRESQIRLADPKRLFSLWTGAYDWTRNQSVTVRAPIGDPTRFLRRSKGIFEEQRWALTLQAGASLVSPHATWERVHVYLDVQNADALLELAYAQGWDVGEDGRLVLMKPHYRHSVWHGMRTIKGLPVVSDLQLALDLWNYPLRGREQSEHLIAARQLL